MGVHCIVDEQLEIARQDWRYEWRHRGDIVSEGSKIGLIKKE
jgi:hypothetical protein